MTIKSLLLGSAAVLALGTSAQAADPIAVALDTCDLLNITGLTISSESNCLKFEGEVSYEWDYNYDAGTDTVSTESTVAWELTATATADSDFGPAFAVIELTGEHATGDILADAVFGDAYVGIGDAASTIIYAGKKGTIGNFDDDETLTAVYTSTITNGLEDEIGGHVIQVQTSLGDGIVAGLGLEDLQNDGEASLVATVHADQDWGTAHATFIFDDLISADNAWVLHTGASFKADDFTFQAGFATASDSTWAALFSAEAVVDMFTAAAGFGTDSTGDWDASLSGVAAIDDATTLTVAATFDESSAWAATIEGEFKASDTLTFDAGVEFTSASLTTFDAGLTWAPGGGFEASAGIDANSDGDYGFNTSFEKAFD